MQISRRKLIIGGALTGSAVLLGNQGSPRGERTTDTFWSESTQSIPTFSVIPVVGDGKWVWRKPPEKGTGYLEPRYFDVSTRIRVTGRGNAAEFIAGTIAPSEFPEQVVVRGHEGTPKGNAAGMLQNLSDGARQLLISIPRIFKGQVNQVESRMRLKVSKSYFGYQRDQFPSEQPKRHPLSKAFLGNSPGITCRHPLVNPIAKTIQAEASHPWDLAKKFHQWVFENIQGQPQRYQGIERAIKKGVGDCEERAAVFICLCRSVGIPARLVWVPGHCWAEILLFDAKDKPHWIPVHTAAYSWFGWTGVHEIVLQKGDAIMIPQKRKRARLVYDHYRCRGMTPKIEFTASIEPVSMEKGKDPGPGAREKLVGGKWKLKSRHQADRFHRSE